MPGNQSQRREIIRETAGAKEENEEEGAAVARVVLPFPKKTMKDFHDFVTDS
jgi:hypothetical protein